MHKVKVKSFMDSNHIILNDLLIFFETEMKENEQQVVFNINGFKFKYLKTNGEAHFYKDIKEAYLEANDQQVFRPSDMLHKSSAYTYLYNYLHHRMADVNRELIDGKKAFSEDWMQNYQLWYKKYKKRFAWLSQRERQFKDFQYYCFKKIGEF